MAPCPIPMPAPVCLIENSPAGELRVQQEALRVLAEIPQPVVVVAIAGLYRTGKSYLLNKLAGKRTGFSLGSPTQSHTKGIWMWCLPHPHRAGHTLVLLDTEGLGDVQKGDAKNDTWIFALAVLLSSTLVYNSRGTIDQQAMDQLHYVTELMEHVKVKATGRGGRQEGEDSAEFVRFFPTFVWALRDFTLQLELDGREITEDEYLENSLKLKTGSSQQTQLYNLPRECIRQFFPARKCFVFVPPAGRRDLARLEELQEDELEPEFREQVARFCLESPVGAFHGEGGGLLGNLAVTYVDTIRSGAVPCVESAVLALAQIENSAAVVEAVAVYEEQLRRQAALPTETVKELLELHAQCEREALRAFMARAFKDDDCRFQGELMKQELCRRNELASSDRCTAALQELWDELDNRIGQGVYSVPGSYQCFLDDRQRMVERYWQVPGKGVKVGEGWCPALCLCAPSLCGPGSPAENQASASPTWAQKEAELQQKREDQECSYQEHVRQLKEKLDGERKKLLEEQHKMVDQKLKVPGGGTGAKGAGWAQPRQGRPCHRPQPAQGGTPMRGAAGALANGRPGRDTGLDGPVGRIPQRWDCWGAQCGEQRVHRQSRACTLQQGAAGTHTLWPPCPGSPFPPQASPTLLPSLLPAHGVGAVPWGRLGIPLKFSLPRRS
uniref:GB1/RHD3-type G domain-containing protein n=1 Tax=Chrysemys picta bellii TaxID=8478 RepID=A0A8C3H9R9_CHRPI